ncbi:Uncharacterised protein [Mycobacterium tuberculosis]|uniref:Uncharacterized protein n=1 Tax=Mycobacterium tuberculosis TaxID=1773 RepID=A0A655J7G2_MYCTX|nr:Uncharacterised protein [Mycobacterium tuberculosis]COW46854.1 Uncharacterised protein [Mycobacterium tuberculosis]
MTAASRCTGSATSVPNVARMVATALPPPSSSLGRTLTGKTTISDLLGSSPSSSRKRRKPPPMIANATSLIVASY